MFSKVNPHARTDGPLRERGLHVEDGAGLRVGVVVVQVRQLPRQGPAHVLLLFGWVLLVG